jgi:hypothetical protein
MAIVRRPVGEVVESVLRTAPGLDRAAMTVHMTRLAAKLCQVAKRLPDVLMLDYADLNDESACATLFEHCLGEAHDPRWWSVLANVNVQINLPAMMRQVMANKPQLDLLVSVAKWHELQRMARARKQSMTDDLVIGQESFETVLTDGPALFAEHAISVGERPDVYLSKNVPLHQQLAERGQLLVTTARSNGKLFGYLFALVSPSLEAEDWFYAVHTLFYASPLFPGLGLRLQHASIDALRVNGVDEVYFRAGVRGSGPRLGPMYRRLGAQPYGQMFKLALNSGVASPRAEV